MAEISPAHRQRAGSSSVQSTASLWHTEPSPLLIRHRTTPGLPRYADYVVVGSGSTGTAVARYFAEDEGAEGAINSHA